MVSNYLQGVELGKF